MASVPGTPAPTDTTGLASIQSLGQVTAAVLAGAGGKAALAMGFRGADQTRELGKLAAQDARNQGRQIAAEGISARAASGVEIGSGSALDLEVAQAGVIEQNVARVRFAAENQAYQQEVAGLFQLAGGLGDAFSLLVDTTGSEFRTLQRKQRQATLLRGK